MLLQPTTLEKQKCLNHATRTFLLNVGKKTKRERRDSMFIEGIIMREGS